MEAKKQTLFDGGMAQLLEELKGAIPLHKQTRKAWTDLLRYYQSNQSRMHYQAYREKGYLIGSGAIEAAPRNIVQQRLKLSGQK